MALFECPECKSKIERQTGKCSHCGVELTICPKCDMVSVGETAFCRSCGYDLDKYRKKLKARAAKGLFDNRPSGETDLVSCLRDTEEKNVLFKILTIIKIVISVIFWCAFAVAIVGGIAISVFGTVTFGQNLGDDNMLRVILHLINAMAAMSGIPVFMVLAYNAIIRIPYGIIGSLIMGICAHKYSFNRNITMLLFENPSLAYGVDDAYNRAFTFYPYIIGKSKGKISVVVLDVIAYALKLIYPALFLVSHFIFLASIGLSSAVVGGMFYADQTSVLLFPVVIGGILLIVYLVFVFVAQMIIDLIIDSIKKGIVKKWMGAIYAESESAE